MLIDIDVNGQTLSADVSPATRLIDLLRDNDLTGAKDACSRGECGACTVLVGDRPVLACLTLAIRVRASVRTVEGLADETRALREAFADHGALQCGYCTPGQIVMAASIARYGPLELPPGSIDGNICRCTGSQPIRDAITEHLGIDHGRR